MPSSRETGRPVTRLSRLVARQVPLRSSHPATHLVASASSVGAPVTRSPGSTSPLRGKSMPTLSRPSSHGVSPPGRCADAPLALSGGERRLGLRRGGIPASSAASRATSSSRHRAGGSSSWCLSSTHTHREAARKSTDRPAPAPRSSCSRLTTPAWCHHLSSRPHLTSIHTRLASGLARKRTEPCCHHAKARGVTASPA